MIVATPSKSAGGAEVHQDFFCEGVPAGAEGAPGPPGVVLVAVGAAKGPDECPANISATPRCAHEQSTPLRPPTIVHAIDLEQVAVPQSEGALQLPGIQPSSLQTEPWLHALGGRRMKRR